MNYLNKIKSKEDFRKFVQESQKDHKTVVQCHGCFDIIHPGHIRYLEQAKSLGDILVVSLTADKFILKGDTRPFMPEELRAKAMAALEIVDAVYVDNESWAGPILGFTQPDIYVKGKEYENTFDGVFGDERNVVEGYGGKMHFTSGEVVFSSSKIIEDFKNKFALDFEVFSTFTSRNNINYDVLNKLIQSFPKQNVAVIGEVVVDEYIHCEVLGLSSEAPIPTIRPIKTEKFVGAAGIIAKHISSFGGTVDFFSICGDDEDGRFIETDLKSAGVNYHITHKGQTIRKTRYIADDHKLVKIDYSKNYELEEDEALEFIESFKKKCSGIQTLIFSDFNYGLINTRIRQELTEWCNENDIKIIADVSSTLGGNISQYNNCFLITPTEKEARMIFNDFESGLSHIAFKLLKMINCKNMVITLGANGLLAFKNKEFSVYGNEEKHLEQEYIPAIEKNAVDPVGAGDAMLAMISLVVSAGGTVAEAVYLGNIASYMEVNILGNSVIPIEKISNYLKTRRELNVGASDFQL